MARKSDSLLRAWIVLAVLSSSAIAVHGGLLGNLVGAVIGTPSPPPPRPPPPVNKPPPLTSQSSPPPPSPSPPPTGLLGGVTGAVIGTVVNTTTQLLNSTVDAVTGTTSNLTGGLVNNTVTAVSDTVAGDTGGVLENTVVNVVNTTLNTVTAATGDTLLTVDLQGISLVSDFLTEVTGKVICDVCQDGGFDDVDSGVANLTVTLSCTIAPPCPSGNSCPDPVVIDIVDVTGPRGFFTLVNVPTVDATLLAGNEGLLGCSLSLGNNSDTGCNVKKAGLCGLGDDLTVNVTGLLSATADVGLGVLCLTNDVVPDTCTIGVEGDPHFTGGFGSHFDFTGEPGKSYCMLSDAHLHINMFLDGRYVQWGDVTEKALTWIRKVSVLWGHHTVLLEARTGGKWEYEKGYMASIAVDGEYVHLTGPGSSAHILNGAGTITWLAARKSELNPMDEYVLKLSDVLKMKIRLQPEIPYMRTDDDAAIHMNMGIEEVRLSPSAHGVLGQTYRAEYRERLKRQKLVHNDQLDLDMVPGDNADGFIDGQSTDYENSGSFFGATCRFSRFVRAFELDSETSAAMEVASGRVEGYQSLPPYSV